MNQETIFANQNISSAQTNPEPKVKPMPFWLSSLFFGIPTLITLASFYLFLPLLERNGLSALISFSLAFGIPTVIMFAVALGAYHQFDGFPLTWTAFSERMWFPKLRFKDILIGIGMFVLAGGVGAAALTPIRNILIDSGLMPLPANIPLLIDPSFEITVEKLDQIAGGNLVGRWDIAVVYLMMFFFNIAGEELWWRGYILPRQEKAHGKYAWLIHGIMWTVFHVFKWWDMIVILPLCLTFAFVSQRLKNNWPTLIAHTLGNLYFLTIILGRVFGA